MRVLSLVLSSLVAALLLCEGALALGLRHPAAVRSPYLVAALRRVHLGAEAHFPQLDPACARWDPELTYTLRPGGCTVRDREFAVRYDANRAGLRDDDASLDAPAIIVLGDSYAMGWGVEQRESFPELIAARTGLRVLDAGVPSYGTARELGLLRRLDRRNLRALVIQFCWNDISENRAWIEHGGHLPVTTEADYAALMAQHARDLRYYPGKYLVTLVGATAARLWPARDADAADSDAVDQAVSDFVQVLDGHHDLLSDVPLVVLSTCEHEAAFATALRARLGGGGGRFSLAPVAVVDPSPHVAPEDLYPLDGHWTAAGHRMVADLIVGELERLRLLSENATR